ncbi:MAG: lysophospholipid acyltransferase family protein [candidate division Zixibacteria bacterium]|nr:lysophospholipid acyltransferase family protein [candidate division Zixibacteria bacterium]
MMRRMRHRVEYLLTRGLGTLVQILPYQASICIGSFLGDLAFSLFRIRRKVALDNLKRAFGRSLAEKEVRRIAREAYRNIGRGLVEYAMFPVLKKKLDKLVKFEGLDNFDRALTGKKGVVLIAGHFGSWELMGAATSQKGYPIDFLVGEQHNILVDNLMNKYRQLMGIGIIKMGVATRGVIKALRNNRFVAMLSDQDAGKDGTMVNFFGYPASTPKGPAAFVLKTEAPLIMGFIIRQDNGRQRIIFEEPIYIRKSKNKDDDIRNLTQAYTSLLEEYIRKYPDHWFWPHRRWKTQSKQ